MKILQVNKFLYPRGGTETYLLSLIKLLSENGHEVICFSQANDKNISGNHYLIDDLELGKFSIKSLLRLPRIFWSLKARRIAKKIITENRPDIVHIHNIYHQISPSILSVFKNAGIPIVMTVHDFKLITPNYSLRADGLKILHKNSWLTDQILKLEFSFHRLLKVYEKNIDLFIAPSNFVKNQLIDHGFEAKKIIVIPHFLADKFFTSPNNNCVQPEKYILAYGRLDESKGFSDLISAFAEINFSNLKLKIAGAGPELNNLQKLTEELNLQNKIEFLGEVLPAKIIDLIQGAFIIANCSRVHETFGYSVLEALALGKFVVASNVGAIPELIVSGQNGLLYETSDIGDLKTRLIEAINGINVISEREIKQSATKYRTDRHYQELLSAYQSIIQTNQN